MATTYNKKQIKNGDYVVFPRTSLDNIVVSTAAPTTKIVGSDGKILADYLPPMSVSNAEVGKAGIVALVSSVNATPGSASTTAVPTEKAVSTALSGKSDTGHKHVKSDITDFGSYAAVGHKHVVADITDFGSYAVVGHKHVKADITDFAHTHTASDLPAGLLYYDAAEVLD